MARIGTFRLLVTPSPLAVNSIRQWNRMNNKGNNHQGNNDHSWGGNNVRKSYDNYYNNNRGDYQQHGGNKIEQRMQNIRLDGGHSSSGSGNKPAAEHKEQGPKKMTWANIASQPAKPQISTTSTTVKKKGFGPPPPMIPGKHSLELTDGWDTPKNGPLVPPSPPVIQPPQPELIEKQSNSNYEGQPAWPTPGQAQNQTPQAAGQNQSSSSNDRNSDRNSYSNQAQQHQHQPPPHQQHQNHQGGRGYHMSNSQNNYQGHSGPHRQYQNSSGPHQNSNSYSSHHHNNYNDFQKPYHQNSHQISSAPPQSQHASAPITRAAAAPPPPAVVAPPAFTAPSDPSEDSILEQLRVKNQYNPADLDLSQVDNARFFVIKSYSEDDIHRSIKYEIWCSTEHGNKRLDQAFREREKENGIIYLFFSVNSSGHFCGVAQMITQVDYNSNSSVWSQDKWKGSFRVKWIYVKDVPNTQLRHIRLENNENKPVTNSRDTQEVPNGHGVQMMKIIHSFKHTTSIFDDFTHYEKRQEEEDGRKHESHDAYKPMTLPPSHHSTHNRENMNRQQQYDNGGGNGGGRSFDRDRDYHNGSSGGGFERGGYNNGSGGYNKYGNSGYNNDYKPSFNNGRGGGGFNKPRNDFRNDRNGDQNSGGFYRAKPDYQNDDFGGSRGGGYRSDRGGSSRGRGSFRPPINNN